MATRGPSGAQSSIDGAGWKLAIIWSILGLSSFFTHPLHAGLLIELIRQTPGAKYYVKTCCRSRKQSKEPATHPISWSENIQTTSANAWVCIYNYMHLNHSAHGNYLKHSERSQHHCRVSFGRREMGGSILKTLSHTITGLHRFN